MDGSSGSSRFWKKEGPPVSGKRGTSVGLPPFLEYLEGVPGWGLPSLMPVCPPVFPTHFLCFTVIFLSVFGLLLWVPSYPSVSSLLPGPSPSTLALIPLPLRVSLYTLNCTRSFLLSLYLPRVTSCVYLLVLASHLGLTPLLIPALSLPVISGAGLWPSFRIHLCTGSLPLCLTPQSSALCLPI